MQICPSASGSWAASKKPGGSVQGSVAYRKIMGLEADPLFREYMRLPLFEDLATAMCGPDVAIVRAMFFNKPKEQVPTRVACAKIVATAVSR